MEQGVGGKADDPENMLGDNAGPTWPHRQQAWATLGNQYIGVTPLSWPPSAS